MRAQRILLTLLAGLLLIGGLSHPQAIRAEFYRYTGEDGAIHFTDDLSQVPPDQRKQMETFTESQPAPPQEAIDIKKEPATETADQAKAAVSFLEEKRQALMTRQEKLKTEYERLMKDRADIETLRQTADTKAKREALKSKVAALQADIDDYQEQTKALGEEVNAFNTAIKSGSPPNAQPQ
jgi:DNA repair exonuclease SbcCD ATPase subunit